MRQSSLKDDRLAELADSGNVAQFVSFAPRNQGVRHSRIRGHAPDYGFETVRQAVASLMQSGRTTGQSATVNVRSFTRTNERGNPFEYGLSDTEEVVNVVTRLADAGYYTIVNETIDVNDGGVSGVLLAGIVEFLPNDTPRGVEKSGTLSLEVDDGLELLQTVYGFQPDIPPSLHTDNRVEFSVHPLRVGYKRSHTILWEKSPDDTPILNPATVWPNKFSEFIGDKAFGLALASIAGLPVPRTQVIGRNVAPFEFGATTNTGEKWMRTCPPVPQPGLHPTTYGWVDPFDLLTKNGLDASAVASIIAQESVQPEYSGAAEADGRGDYRVEGVRGKGDGFMLGSQAPDALPQKIVDDVKSLGSLAESRFGPVRFEFVHDGDLAWIIQLHISRTKLSRSSLHSTEQDPEGGWVEFDPDDGLDRLRHLLKRAVAEGAGVKITKPVGMTSHVGELLRLHGVVSKLS